MNAVALGKTIRAYRKQKKWTQETFAERIGLSLTYVGMIERGEKIPKLETFVKIANTLEVSADDLLSGTATGHVSDANKEAHLNQRLDLLPPEEREKVYAVLEALLNH